MQGRRQGLEPPPHQKPCPTRSPPKWNDTLYMGLCKAAILSPSQLSVPLAPLILKSMYATPLYMCKEVRGRCFMYRIHRHRLFTLPIHFRTKLFVAADLVGVDLQDNFISQSYQSDSHLMTGLCLTGTSPNVITSLKVQYSVGRSGDELEIGSKFWVIKRWPIQSGLAGPWNDRNAD